MRHVLVVNVFFAPNSYGGATVVAEQVAASLRRQNLCRVSAVSLCCRVDLPAYHVIKCEKDGIESYLINLPKDRSYGLSYHNPDVTTRLAELIDTLEPDLIHAHCLQDMGTGLFDAAELAGVPVILSVHDFWWLCERQFMIRMDGTYCAQSPVQIDGCRGCVDHFWSAKTRFQHLQAQGHRAKHVTYPSIFAKSLSEASGFAPGRGTVWPNGVQMPGPRFFEAQAARRAADSRVCFGFLGGPSQIKGWPDIREAFRNLGRDDFRGILVDGSLDGSWWTPRHMAPLSGQWDSQPRFAQSEMDRFYAEIDVLLFMSQWKETFGLAIREALARGIEVIQTDSGGTVEHDAVVQDRLVPIGAGPALLRRQILAALDRPERGRPPVAVTDFDTQARAFASLMDEVLADGAQTASVA